jgi:hypothetical protein
MANIGSSQGSTPPAPTDKDSLLGYNNTPQDRSSRQPDKINGLLPTYFKLELDRASTMTYFCQNVNLPGVSVSMIPQPTQFVPIPRSGSVEYEELTMQFLVDEDLSNWLEIYNWMMSITTEENFDDIEDAPQHYSDANLFVLNSAMKPNIRIQFKNIIPKNLSGLEFDSTASAPEPLTANVTFQYTSYDIHVI